MHGVKMPMKQKRKMLRSASGVHWTSQSNFMWNTLDTLNKMTSNNQQQLHNKKKTKTKTGKKNENKNKNGCRKSIAITKVNAQAFKRDKIEKNPHESDKKIHTHTPYTVQHQFSKRVFSIRRVIGKRNLQRVRNIRSKTCFVSIHSPITSLGCLIHTQNFCTKSSFSIILAVSFFFLSRAWFELLTLHLTQWRFVVVVVIYYNGLMTILPQ